MSKNEKDWFATLAGDKVVNMDSKTRLQARLVRAVLKKRSDEINKEINLQIVYSSCWSELILYLTRKRTVRNVNTYLETLLRLYAQLVLYE